MAVYCKDKKALTKLFNALKSQTEDDYVKSVFAIDVFNHSFVIIKYDKKKET